MNELDPLANRFPFYPRLRIKGKRESTADELLSSSIAKLQACTSDPTTLCDWVNTVKYRFENIPQRGLTSRGLIRLNPEGMTEWTVVHELAHAWDAARGWKLSELMAKATGSFFPSRWLHIQNPADPAYWYHVGSPPAPCGIDKNFNAKEDFAESVTAYLFPEEAHRKAEKRKASYEEKGFTHFHETPRGKFIKDLFN